MAAYGYPTKANPRVCPCPVVGHGGHSRTGCHSGHTVLTRLPQVWPQGYRACATYIPTPHTPQHCAQCKRLAVAMARAYRLHGVASWLGLVAYTALRLHQAQPPCQPRCLCGTCYTRGVNGYAVVR